MKLLYAAVVAVLLAALATGLAPTGSTIGQAIRFEVPKDADLFRADDPGRRRRSRPGRALEAGRLASGRPRRAGRAGAGVRGAAAADRGRRGARPGRAPTLGEPLDLAAQRPVRVLAGLSGLRAEIDAGRITASTPVLHVARSFQPWVSIPLAVFTGVMETTATLDPERSIHTEGRRLLDVADLSALLATDFPYVVLEPAGLDPDLGATIEAAGYRSIFANERAELFGRMARLRE